MNQCFVIDELVVLTGLHFFVEEEGLEPYRIKGRDKTTNQHLHDFAAWSSIASSTCVYLVLRLSCLYRVLVIAYPAFDSRASYTVNIRLLAVIILPKLSMSKFNWHSLLQVMNY